MFNHRRDLQFACRPDREGAPAETVDRVIRANPMVAAVVGGTDLESALVSAAGRPNEEPARGGVLLNPWRQSGTTDRQNLLADFLANAKAERDHRAAIRDVRDGSDDPDIRQLLSCLLASTDEHRRECATAVAALTEEPEERVYPGKPTQPKMTGATR